MLSDWISARNRDFVRSRVRDRGPRLARLLVFAMLGAVGLLVNTELNNLIGEAVGQDGQSHPLTDVIGPSALAGIPSWQQWVTSGYAEPVALWIAGAVVADGLFVLAYAVVLLRLVKRASPPVRTSLAAPRSGVNSLDAEGGDLGHGRSRGWTNFSLLFLQLLLVLEALEAVVLLMGAGVLASTQGSADSSPSSLAAIGGVEAGIATAKWLVVVLLVVAVLRNAGTRHVLWRVVKNTAEAVWVHRLSAVLVVALVVLACVPGSDLLNQLPDVQRQWLDDIPVGTFHYALAAALTIGAAASGLFVLGRQRARCSYDFRVRQTPDVEKLPLSRQWGWWLLPVAGWVVAAVWTLIVVAMNGFSWASLWSQFGWAAALVVGIPLLLLGLSWALDRYRPPADAYVKPDFERSVYAWLLGDVLAVLVLCVGGLGLVRSFTAPAFLTGSGWSIAFLLLGGVTAVLWPVVLIWTSGVPAPKPMGFWRTLWSWPRRKLAGLNLRMDPTVTRTESKAARNRWTLFVIILIGIAVIAWALVYPTSFASLLGGVGVTVLLISAWGAVLGAFTVALQDFQLLAVFRVLRLKAAPVLTLAVVAPLVFTLAAASMWGGDPTAHAVRLGYESSSSTPEQSSSSDVVNTLHQRIADSSCVVTLPNGAKVKPVIVVAAEGGGIRAAYFTVKALSKLKSSGCLGSAVLLSSGVSGGSLGLALTKTNSGDPLPVVKKVAGQDIVATGVTGLLAGDLVASNLGVHVPSIIGNQAMWRDRAALIEEGWMGAAHSLRDQFDESPGDATGYALLNSTDARSKCRVIVGQLPVGTKTTNGNRKTPITCGRPDTEPSATDDLPTIYGDSCRGSLDWAGAAMLSARFPIITPAGRFPSGGSCFDGQTTELIDGGYAEGSALGTVADLSPTVTAAVRHYNQSTKGGPYALPLLLFLRNSSGFDLEPREAGVVAEPLVPLEGRKATAVQSDQRALIQRIMSNFGTACADDSKCSEQTGGFAKEFHSQAVVVSPFTRPTIAAPLGWALSSYSVNSLCDAVNEASLPTDHIQRSDYAQLADLTGLQPDTSKREDPDCGQ